MESIEKRMFKLEEKLEKNDHKLKMLEVILSDKCEKESKQESWDVPEGLKFFQYNESQFNIVINDIQIIKCSFNLYDIETYDAVGELKAKDYKIIRCNKEDIEPGEICLFSDYENPCFYSLIKDGEYGFILGNGKLLSITIADIETPYIWDNNEWDHWFKIVKR